MENQPAIDTEGQKVAEDLPWNEIHLIKNLKDVQIVLHNGLFQGALAGKSQAAIVFVERSILDILANLRKHPKISEFEHLL